MKPVKLDASGLIDKAIKKAGCSDLGDDDFREGLARFLESVECEGELTLLIPTVIRSKSAHPPRA